MRNQCIYCYRKNLLYGWICYTSKNCVFHQWKLQWNRCGNDILLYVLESIICFIVPSCSLYYEFKHKKIFMIKYTQHIYIHVHVTKMQICFRAWDLICVHDIWLIIYKEIDWDKLEQSTMNYKLLWISKFYDCYFYIFTLTFKMWSVNHLSPSTMWTEDNYNLQNID